MNFPIVVLQSCVAFVLWSQICFGLQNNATDDNNLHPSKQVTVNEIVLDSAVDIIEFSGDTFSIVWCVTLSGKLYRSLDSGKEWNDISDILVAESDGHATKAPNILKIHVHPKLHDHVVLLTDRPFSYITKDGGRTISIFKTAHRVGGFEWHPTDPRKALYASWEGDCKTHSTNDPSDGECSNVLYRTKNGAKSFEKIVTNVVQYTWGMFHDHDSYSILYTQFNPKLTKQPRMQYAWSEEISFYVLNEKDRSGTLLVKSGNRFVYSNGYLFVAALTNVVTQDVSLYISTDSAKSFTKAKLPEKLSQFSYSILDTEENAIMIHVNHGATVSTGEFAVGNVYISDETGTRFSLSLQNNVRTSSGDCEFERVASVNGVYIANFLYKESTVETTDEKEALKETSSGENDWSSFGSDSDFEPHLSADRFHGGGRKILRVKSSISFNKGGMWSLITPPKVDSQGRKIFCGQEYGAHEEGTEACSLHLHSMANFDHFAPVYSTKSAAGLIIGTGNVGAFLSDDSDDVNTYLSRDGGVTWAEAHKGPFIYEMGDHGGLILMADDLKKTNQVVFSWNEGLSWYDFELGTQPLDVQNIILEPKGASIEFLLYGTRGTAGVIYHLDFASLKQPLCKGVWAADSVSSDYETWTPTDPYSSNHCMLGKTVSITRRKPTSECFNGKDFDRPIEKNLCECTKNDFECEYGFTRHLGHERCVAQHGEVSREGCTSSGIFYTDAYRKIPGDVCQGGWQPEKVAVLCPDSSPFSSRARTLLFSLIGIIILIAALAYISNHPTLKNYLIPHGQIIGMSSARYAVLGAASRVAEGLDYVVSATSSPSAAPSYNHSTVNMTDDIVNAYNPWDATNVVPEQSTHSTEMEFSETQNQRGSTADDDNEPPPLLDLSDPRETSYDF